MKELVARLTEERDQLAGRIHRLNQKLLTPEGVGPQQVSLLYAQLGCMRGYLNVLNKRILLLQTPHALAPRSSEGDQYVGRTLEEIQAEVDADYALGRMALGVQLQAPNLSARQLDRSKGD